MTKNLLVLNAATVALAIAMLWPANASGQSNVEDIPGSVDTEKRIFPADYFTDYVPRTALDMINRIPGFAIVAADERRGLGQGGANILVNGKRLTGKTEPEDELGRISASRVTQIEIVDGASLSIPGLSGQVANIQTQTSGIGVTWEWTPEFRQGIEPDWFRGETNISGESGALVYNVKLRNRSLRVRKKGPEFLTDGQGVLFEIRDEEIKEYSDRPGIGIDLNYKPAPGHIINVNAQYDWFKFRGTVVSTQTAVTPAGSDINTFLTVRGDERSANIGADYEFPLGNNTLKLIGFKSWKHTPTVRQFDILDATGLIGRSRFPQTADEAELIIRSEYSWTPQEGRDWQLGLEGAFNSLEVENQLLTQGPGGQLSGNPANGFDVGEDRAEITLTHSRQISPALSVQVSLGGEYSKLSQSQNGVRSSDDRQFYRPKGFLGTTYKFSPTLDLRARIERSVGQLDFFDFVSSTNLQDDLDVTANPQLVPEQSWSASVEFDKDLGHGNRFKAKLYGAIISDIVDLVPIGANGEGIGNLDKAYRYGIDLSSTLRGDRLGLPGTQLDLQLELRQSSLNDALQDFSRSINSDREVYYKAAFRHDIPDTDWAYGFSAERDFKAFEYRSFSFSESNVTRPQAKAFIEHKNIAGLKLVAEVSNIANQGELLERSFFTDRRDIGQRRRTERRIRRPGAIVTIRLSGEF